MYVIAREKQGKQFGSGAIADRETDSKNETLWAVIILSGELLF
jgi:hypothetical protein